MKIIRLALIILMLGSSLLMQACTSVRTFPSVARAGDTISLMIGSSTQANKNTISATLTDSAGVSWNLSDLGLIRSVFNLRPDGRAKGMHYSNYLDVYTPWYFGHEPVQTVLVTDLPSSGVALGTAYLTISLNVTDNSSGVSDPFTVALDIVAGQGSTENFPTKRLSATQFIDFTKLEPAPYLKVDFNSGTTVIGAASLIIDFDETVVNPDDLNIYSPESTVRGSVGTPGAFGKTQRMINWHQDGQKLYVDIIAPQGIGPRFLRFFVMHPDTVTGNPNFTLQQADIYDVNGNPIYITPTLDYHP